MFSYIGYGLCIRSYLRLPELVAAEAEPDVCVRRGQVSAHPTPAAASVVGVRAARRAVSLHDEEVGTVSVKDGRVVVVEPAADADERALRLFILGRVMALLLHQRGLLALHGSAVDVGGRAVVFLGGSGWGKSTTAAALHRRGHAVLADDVVAVEASEGRGLKVVPGCPQLKLWPDAAAWLGDPPDELPRLHPSSEKRARHVARGFSHSPLPLARVYVLGEGPRVEVEPLPPQEAFAELVRHSHAARYERLLEETRTAATHLRQCARLAGSALVFGLKRPRTLSAMPLLTELVETDLAGSSNLSPFGPGGGQDG